MLINCITSELDRKYLQFYGIFYTYNRVLPHLWGHVIFIDRNFLISHYHVFIPHTVSLKAQIKWVKIIRNHENEQRLNMESRDTILGAREDKVFISWSEYSMSQNIVSIRNSFL